MSEPISIGTNTLPNLVIDRLNAKLDHLLKDGLPLAIDIDKIGDFTFMDCHIKSCQDTSEEDVFNVTKSYIANCLADIIVDEWESRIVRKIVQGNYFYYNEEEKNVILNKAKEMLNPEGYASFQRRQRKETILLKVQEYLDLHKELILEGFINFRLKEYQQELADIVNYAVDEFLLEKEYIEFIRLLRYFVDIQEPRIETIKIVFKKNDKFTLLDSNDQLFQHECLDGLMVDFLENDINYDDLLISALITLAPREIELHIQKEVKMRDAIKTIQNVFGQRVKFCNGCSICRPASQ